MSSNRYKSGNGYFGIESTREAIRWTFAINETRTLEFLPQGQSCLYLRNKLHLVFATAGCVDI